MDPTRLGPQAGPQTDFLTSAADIALYGGAAGGGKSYALLLEPLRHHNNPGFSAVIFRRNATQVRNPGGLWDESRKLYSQIRGHSKELSLEWIFPAGMRVKFAHLEYDSTVYDWQGSQIPLICFDELTHFAEEQFWYMLSRNRSTSGIGGYIRATTNPDADSWVRQLVDWWIGSDGYPIKERSGVLRWFIRQDNQLIWADTKEELLQRYGESSIPKSLTLISAKLSDNRILMDKDPGYLANLMALPRVERERLLGGNWDVKPSSGNFFQRENFPVLENLNGIQIVRTIRYWDRAATKPSETNSNPDWTVGIKLSQTTSGMWLITDMVRFRDTPLKVEEAVINCAKQDGFNTWVGLEQDPGSAGVADIDNMVRKLPGFITKICKPTRDKITRAMPVSAQCERRNVYILRGAWNTQFLSECENFPPEKNSSSHDDIVDAFSGAFNELTQGSSILDVL